MLQSGQRRIPPSSWMISDSPPGQEGWHRFGDGLVDVCETLQRADIEWC
jgi:hypothetical protein